VSPEVKIGVSKSMSMGDIAGVTLEVMETVGEEGVDGFFFSRFGSRGTMEGNMTRTIAVIAQSEGRRDRTIITNVSILVTILAKILHIFTGSKEAIVKTRPREIVDQRWVRVTIGRGGSVDYSIPRAEVHARDGICDDTNINDLSV
jgi:hypothetical protein